MICKQCNENNNYNANYCKKCGYKFTEEEKTNSYNKTFLYKLDQIEEWLSWLNLKIITDNKYIKIGLILLILLLGIGNVIKNGTEFKILNSHYYEIQFNKNTKEYYLISEQPSISLNLYIPKEAENISVTKLNDKNQIIEKQTYSTNQEIILYNSYINHYDVQVNYDNGNDNLLIYVYLDK